MTRLPPLAILVLAVLLLAGCDPQTSRPQPVMVEVEVVATQERSRAAEDAVGGAALGYLFFGKIGAVAGGAMGASSRPDCVAKLKVAGRDAIAERAPNDWCTWKPEKIVAQRDGNALILDQRNPITSTVWIQYGEEGRMK